MSRYYTKSLILIVFTLVSYFVTRLISPNLSDSDEISRRLHRQKAQGAVKSSLLKHAELKQQKVISSTIPSNIAPSVPSRVASTKKSIEKEKQSLHAPDNKLAHKQENEGKEKMNPLDNILQDDKPKPRLHPTDNKPILPLPVNSNRTAAVGQAKIQPKVTDNINIPETLKNVTARGPQSRLIAPATAPPGQLIQASKASPGGVKQAAQVSALDMIKTPQAPPGGLKETNLAAPGGPPRKADQASLSGGEQTGRRRKQKRLKDGSCEGGVHSAAEYQAHWKYRPKGLDKRLPTVFCIGAKKSGTGALMQFLDMHPNISSFWGEAHFFDEDINYKKDLHNYRLSMPMSYASQITIEKTPKYLFDWKVPLRIQCYNSSIKLIVILKDPVRRLVSDYVHEVQHGKKINVVLPENRRKFEDLVINNVTKGVNVHYEPVQVSIYHDHLERWFKLFPRDQFLILDGESFEKNPVPTLTKVETFLKLPKYFSRDLLKYDENKGYYCLTKKPRKGSLCMDKDKGRPRDTYPTIDKTVLAKLTAFYKPHNEKLYNLIGENFNW